MKVWFDIVGEWSVCIVCCSVCIGKGGYLLIFSYMVSVFYVCGS